MATQTEIGPLRIGVIRDSAYYRANSALRDRADAEYKAVRPASMAKGKYTCVYCNWVSREHNECHHKDGNHANNDQSNHLVVDSLCHGYHHIGQRASQERFSADNLGDKTLIAAIPELTAEDLNLLQRAIGVALLDEGEDKEIAREILQILSDRATAVKNALGTFRPGDIAAAMARLSDMQYEERDAVCAPMRVLFRQDLLEAEGRKFKKDYPGLPLESWPAIFREDAATP